jgi:hypothetical protein
MSLNDEKDSKDQNLDNKTEIGYLPSLSVIIERSESKDETLWTFEEALKVIGEPEKFEKPTKK